MALLNKRSLVWLATTAFSTAVLAQSAAIDPNDPVLKTLRDMEAGELLPLKNHCLETYPKLASSIESQAKARLQAMYGADYAAKVKNLVASRQFKAGKSASLVSIKAWPENIQRSRCENLPAPIPIEADFVNDYRNKLEKAVITFTDYARACNTLYPGEKFSQQELDQRIEALYGEGAQAQRKYQTLLAKPETKAELADGLKDFEAQRGDNSYRLLDQCFSMERRASGALLPIKVKTPSASPASK